MAFAPSPPSAAAETMPSNGCSDTFMATLDNALVDVRTAILDIVPPEGALLKEAMTYALGKPGKLLRPKLGVLMASCFLDPIAPSPTYASILETAAAAEMIHLATLLHDDVLDHADTRRGRPTLNRVLGNTTAILSGDYLLAQASRKLAKVGVLRNVALFSDVLADLCDGELEQHRTQFLWEGTQAASVWESYLRKSIGKTASLFRAACSSQAILLEQPETVIAQAATYGEAFGLAFQLMDDWLDYTASAETLGKPALGDLCNGMLTAPILLALDTTDSENPITPTSHAALCDIVQTVFDTQTLPESTAITLHALLAEAHVPQRMPALIEHYSQKALTAIAPWPEGAAKAQLMDLITTAASRPS